jgi:hypothetical protein
VDANSAKRAIAGSTSDLNHDTTLLLPLRTRALEEIGPPERDELKGCQPARLDAG